jgi:hypothetical protein
MRFNTWSLLGALALLALSSACGTESPAANGSSGSNVLGPGDSCAPGSVVACNCYDGAAGQALCRDNLTFSACLCDVVAAPLVPGMLPNEQMAMAGASGVPCAVASVAEQNCWGCHGTTLQYTAPMRLVTWEDFQAPTPSNPSVPVYQSLMQRVTHATLPMPPAPNPRLSAGDVSVLDAWIAGGALRSSEVCTDQGTAGEGSIDTPIDMMEEPLPEDVECYDFFANNGSGQPYDVPSTPDYYHCFNFKAPWTGDVQGVSSISTIDNTASVHHWILYSAPVSQDSIGGSCSGQHSNGQFVVGWAPGANDLEMPDGVGLEIPKQGFQLEIHYNAPSAGQKDRSGVKLCVTKQLRPNTAAVHPLGAEWALPTSGAGNITGTCEPNGPFPIQIITSSPHMHKKGTHMKTVIMRAGGGMETLIDQAFDFNTQLAYPTPKTINQGDTLVTTCTYNGSATFGTSTTQEMCYNFITAYPAGALAGGGGLSNNGNTCIQPAFGF